MAIRTRGCYHGVELLGELHLILLHRLFGARLDILRPYEEDLLYLLLLLCSPYPSHTDEVESLMLRLRLLPDPTVVAGRSFQHMFLLVLIDECDRMTSPINLWIILLKPWFSDNDVIALNRKDREVQSISVRCDFDIGGGNSLIHHPYVAITELDSLLLSEWRRVEVVPLHEFLRNEVVR